MSLFDDASLVLIPDGAKDGTLYSVKPTDGTGDFTFTRGSNLAATRVDENGLIEKGRENLLTYSNTFSSWTLTGGTISSGQSGYDGSTDAWLLTTTASTEYIEKGQSVSGVQTFSVYAKAGTVDGIVMRFIGGSNPFIFWNLNDGSYAGSTSGASIVARESVSVGNGWYRFSITMADTSASVRIYCGTSSGLLATGNIYIQDAQLELGLVATDYIETGASTAQAGILEDMPRLDYSGGTCPALLLEPQRTNLITQSEYGGAWTTSAATTADNAMTSLEGVENAIELDVTSNAGGMYYNIAVTAETDYVFSFYVKQGTNTENYLTLRDNSNGVFFDANTAYTASSSEWTRIEHEFTTPAGCTNLRVYPQRYAFGGVGTTYFYGFQLEAGSYPTSYIPTYGTSVTRGGEDCSKTGATSLIGQTEGTYFLDFKNIEGNGTTYLASLDNGTSNERIELFNYLGNISVSVRDGGVQQVNMISSVQASGNHKIAFAYKQNDFAFYIDGAQISLDTSGTLPTINQIKLYGRYDGASNGGSQELNQALLFKERLSNADLATLTTL